MKSNGYEITHYFAYGSNMNSARMQARGIDFQQVLAGSLNGYSLRFDKRASGKDRVAYANIGYQPEGCVEGVLYQLSNPDDIVIMDPFEGSPVRYSREVFSIDTVQGIINAWVYVANKALLAEGLLPERRYLDHLLAGRQWHSTAYQQWLKNHPCIEQEACESPDGLIYNV
jgi:gamma-glutamylcyclotransferase (GGCT)/AIG2-like uncharacterized protein YtfP